MLASLALHAGVLGLLARRKAVHPVRHLQVALAPARARPEQPARAPGPAAAPARLGKRPVPGATRPAAQAAAGPETQGPAASPKAAGPAPWSREWRIAQGLGNPALSTELAPTLPPGAETDGPVREPTAQERLAEEKRTVKRRIQGFLDDAAATERARVPDAGFRPLSQALAAGFDPGWDVLESGPDDSPQRRSEFWKQWSRAAAAYGKSGSPFTGADAPGARHGLNSDILHASNDQRGLDSPSLARAPGLDVGLALQEGAASGLFFQHKLIATVRITQRDDGSFMGARIELTSGNQRYDALALTQAQKLARLTLRAVEQGKESLWAFETDFTRIPPAPIVGCALDDFVPKKCFYPLQKLARSRVRLLAVY